jgi:hypothetical protein
MVRSKRIEPSIRSLVNAGLLMRYTRGAKGQWQVPLSSAVLLWKEPVFQSMLPVMAPRKARVIVLAAVTVFLFIIISSLTDFRLLDTMWRPTAEEIHLAVSPLTDRQIRAYRVMLAVDFLYAAAYTGLIVMVFRYYGSNQRFRGVLHRAGIAAAGAAGVSDYLENGLILTVLAALPRKSPVAPILGLITSLKWIAIASAAALLGSMVVGMILSSIRRSRPGPP